jgi:hypothetical protein
MASILGQSINGQSISISNSNEEMPTLGPRWNGKAAARSKKAVRSNMKGDGKSDEKLKVKSTLICPRPYSKFREYPGHRRLRYPGIPRVHCPAMLREMSHSTTLYLTTSSLIKERHLSEKLNAAVEHSR